MNNQPFSSSGAEGPSSPRGSASGMAGFSGLPPPPPPPPLPQSFGSMDYDGTAHSPASSMVSRHSATGRTLSYFRTILGHRNHDYRSDGPGMSTMGGSRSREASGLSELEKEDNAVAAALSPGTDPARGSYSSQQQQQQHGSMQQQHRHNTPRFRRFRLSVVSSSVSNWSSSRTQSLRRAWYRWSVPRRATFNKVLDNLIYKVVVWCFTLILLFGADLQWGLLPPAADTPMEWVFVTAFVFFVMDIFMRIDAEPQYFSLRFPCCDGDNRGAETHRRSNKSSFLGSSSETNNNINNSANNNNNNDANNGPGAVANINNSAISNASGHAPLNKGQPTNGGVVPARRRKWWALWRIRLGSGLFWCDVISSLTLLTQIPWINPRNFQQITVNITLDVFGIPSDGLDSFNRGIPVSLAQDLLILIATTARVARFIRSSSTFNVSSKINWWLLVNLLNPFFYLERLMRKKKAPEATPDDAITSMTATSSASGGLASVAERPRSLDGTREKRLSWGGLGLTALAAVKSQTPLNAGGWGKRKGLWMLPFIGRRGSYEDLKKTEAAIKIQRAWRAQNIRRTTLDSIHESSQRDEVDFAWRGRPSATATAMERVLNQRSFAIRRIHGKSPRLNHRKSSADEMTVSSLGPVNKQRQESQVGSAMRELTGQRVAFGIIFSLVCTALFTYTEEDTTRASTMIVLHTQTTNVLYADRALEAARASSTPDLFWYQFANGTVTNFSLSGGENPFDLRPRETLRINVNKGEGTRTTSGLFAWQTERRDAALVSFLSTIFVLLVWFFGVSAFAGPIMILVVIPIERMVRLLGMLTVDPLGYENTRRYQRFVSEEDEITKNTRWTKEILKGMETSFLMSTILRIGSLMKVGFGSAGVEIIRTSLQKGQRQDMQILGHQGMTVSCIFLFCDIRQFTDATECLQEEVFVFTNRIAGVVHSNCHAYGGSANKNVGDAFLLSWLLDEEPTSAAGKSKFSTGDRKLFTAKNSQADKALLSVVKICMALHHDDYYLAPLSDWAKEALLAKLSKRKGPVVQLGFGMHAGRAVQGAIGSQRKIDATYVSEAVERAEFLESSTKKYGLKMLMSDSFHRLLHPSNRRRCRKIDQILIREEGEDGDEDDVDRDRTIIELLKNGDIMELLTFDLDIDALWRDGGRKAGKSESDSDMGSDLGSKREGLRSGSRQGSGVKKGRRRSTRLLRTNEPNSDELSDGPLGAAPPSLLDFTEREVGGPPELVLPSGLAVYNPNFWTCEEMKKVRRVYQDGLFFQKFNSGLQAFYSKDWDHAKQCFETILERFEDGPSRYFLDQILEHKGQPPKGFKEYGSA